MTVHTEKATLPIYMEMEWTDSFKVNTNTLRLL